jgi:hypothetical protein
MDGWSIAGTTCCELKELTTTDAKIAKGFNAEVAEL